MHMGYSVNSRCLVSPLYGGLVGSICVSSEFLAHRQQVCVSIGQRPVCGLMPRAANRLVEVKNKDDSSPPDTLSLAHTILLLLLLPSPSSLS